MGIDNVLQESVTVALDKERELKFNLRAFAFLAKRYGSVQKALDRFYVIEDITQLSESYLEVLLDLAEAGFLYDKEMSRAMIEDLVDSKNIFNLIVAIRKAIAIKIPEPKGGEADPQ